MVRGTYFVASIVAVLWCTGISASVMIFDDWFLANPLSYSIITAGIVGPVWGIFTLVRIFEGQYANEISVKDMQNLVASIERQIYDRITQSTFVQPASFVRTEEPIESVKEPSISYMSDLDAGDTDTSILETGHNDIPQNAAPIHAVSAETDTLGVTADDNIDANLDTEIFKIDLDNKSNETVEIKLLEDFSWINFIQAADFPQDASDEQTLMAIKSALADPLSTRFLQSAENILAWLAEKDLFMEDYEPEIPEVQNWYEPPLKLSFNRSSLTAARRIAHFLNEDLEKNEAVKEFFDIFDAVVLRIFEETNGREILGLADTRSGRAYLLLIRAQQISGDMEV